MVSVSPPGVAAINSEFLTTALRGIGDTTAPCPLTVARVARAAAMERYIAGRRREIL